MAIKMFNKGECEYKGGYIVCEGKVVCIDNKVVDMFNKLDLDVQRAQFESTNCPDVVKPTGEFVPKSEHGQIYPKIEANTPELDEFAEHAMKIMDEIDSINDANMVNEYIEGVLPIFEFVAEDFIVSGEQPTQHRFDLPTLGNPLELTKEDVCAFILSIFE